MPPDDAAPALVHASPACRNCRATLNQPQARFCSNCGQETNIKPPTLLPFFALWQKLVYLNRRLYYTEHLVFALLAAKRVYGGRWWPLLLRAATVSLFYLVTLSLVMACLAVATLLF